MFLKYVSKNPSGNIFETFLYKEYTLVSYLICLLTFIKLLFYKVAFSHFLKREWLFKYAWMNLFLLMTKEFKTTSTNSKLSEIFELTYIVYVCVYVHECIKKLSTGML